MAGLYALWGDRSQTWITYLGKVLVHGDRAELEFLFPTFKVVPFVGQTGQTMQIRDHPQMAPVRWPLDRRDFK